MSREHTVLMYSTAYNLWTSTWFVHFKLPFRLKGTENIHTEGFSEFPSNIYSILFDLWSSNEMYVYFSENLLTMPFTFATKFWNCSKPEEKLLIFNFVMLNGSPLSLLRGQIDDCSSCISSLNNEYSLNQGRDRWEGRDKGGWGDRGFQ